MRTCSKCKECLSFDNFYKNENYTRGYSYSCKNCLKIDIRERYQVKEMEYCKPKVKKYTEYLECHGYVVLRK